jgi:hypothetical protein
MKYIKYFIFFLILFFAPPCFAVTYYFKTAGVNTNWTTAGNWCTETNGGGTCGTAPTASIDAVLDQYSGTVILDAATCVAKTLTVTSNAVTLATGTGKLTLSGSYTQYPGMTVSGTGILVFSAAGTLTTAGIAIPNLSVNSTSTITIPENITITGTLAVLSSTCTFSGAFNINCANLIVTSSTSSAATLILPINQTLTVSTSIFSNGAYSSAYAKINSLIRSGTASTTTNLVYNGSYANCLIADTYFTDVVYSGSTVGNLDDWYGTLTRSTGITVRNSPISAGGGAWGF